MGKATVADLGRIEMCDGAEKYTTTVWIAQTAVNVPLEVGDRARFRRKSEQRSIQLTVTR